jgi:cytochrome c biogenesis protein CcdA
VGGIAVAIGLQLVGLYEFNLPFPGHLQPKQRGLLGAFILGLIFGIVSSPCATPILALILTFVATKGEVVYGTSLLFIYALGHCALIFLAGTATGFAEGFIKSKGISNLTTWGKRIGGSIVVLVGVYMFYLGVTL